MQIALEIDIEMCFCSIVVHVFIVYDHRVDGMFGVIHALDLMEESRWTVNRLEMRMIFFGDAQRIDETLVLLCGHFEVKNVLGLRITHGQQEAVYADCLVQ